MSEKIDSILIMCLICKDGLSTDLGPERAAEWIGGHEHTVCKECGGWRSHTDDCPLGQKEKGGAVRGEDTRA